MGWKRHQRLLGVIMSDSDAKIRVHIKAAIRPNKEGGGLRAENIPLFEYCHFLSSSIRRRIDGTRQRLLRAMPALLMILRPRICNHLAYSSCSRTRIAGPTFQARSNRIRKPREHGCGRLYPSVAGSHWNQETVASEHPFWSHTGQE